MNKKLVSNTFHLYILTLIKVFVPIAIMPYLATVLSTEQYAAYSYVRSCVTFVNLIMDYGFIYSATKDIARADDKYKASVIMSEVTGTKSVLFVIVFILMIFMVLNSKKTHAYVAYSMITVLAAGINNILPDYLFRGIEKMSLLSMRLVISKLVTTVMLFFLVKGECDFNMVAYLELFGSLIALIITVLWLTREKYYIYPQALFGKVFKRLKEGWYFFVVTVAPSAYGALNMIFVGNELSATDVIYWSTAWNIVSAILNMYNPIINGIYPYMLKKRDFGLIKKIMFIALPVLLCGAVFTVMCSSFAFRILTGNSYVEGSYTLALLTPVLVFAFPGMLLGAPVLGVIGKDKELSNVTIFAAVFHVTCLIIIHFMGKFSLTIVCLLRSLTEFICMCLRLAYVFKYRLEFK